ncbi:MAG: hypothetical protein NTX15_04705 [Candidatus Kapabacteria bacterium]|nr:hypothetical protein [Candidatus Kapabacteria bacterium]
MLSRVATICCFLVVGFAPGMAQLSLITFLNNSPDPALKTADLYVTQVGTTTKIEDIAFQSADNLNSVAIFGDIEVTFAIAPGSSINAGEALKEYKFTPSPDKGYMVIVSGVKTPASYAVNPNGKSTALAFLSFLVEPSVADPNKTGVYFAHGSTDLEAGDIWVRGASKAAVSAIPYGDRSLTATVVDRKTTTIDFTKTGDKTKVIASFSVDYASLASAIIVSVISGFKAPDDNSGSKDTLALLSVLEDGRVVKSPLIAGSQTSRYQFVHNAADPSLATIDVWVNGVRAFDNLGFRKATVFTVTPSNTPVVIGFAPPTSTVYKDTLMTITLDPLRAGRSYTFVASGVVDTSKFKHNPNGRPFKLNVSVLEGALEQSSETGKSAVRAGHYSTDSPTITLSSTTTTYGSKMSYGDAAPEYTLITPRIDTIWVVDSADKKVKGYVCDLRGTNKSFLVLASGFAKPDSNLNGPAFKLILVEASGAVSSSLVEVDPGTVSVDEDAYVSATWSIGPNPSGDVLNISFPIAPMIVENDYRAEVISIAGSVVSGAAMVSDGTSLRASISVTSIANGTYRVRVVSSGGHVLGSKGLVVTR